MDDLTLGGSSDVDIDCINNIQDDTGMRINVSNWEIISHGSRQRAEQFEGFMSLAREEAELLGAPFFAGEMDDLENRCSDLNTAVRRLSL